MIQIEVKPTRVDRQRLPRRGSRPTGGPLPVWLLSLRCRQQQGPSSPRLMAFAKRVDSSRFNCTLRACALIFHFHFGFNQMPAAHEAISNVLSIGSSSIDVCYICMRCVL